MSEEKKITFEKAMTELETVVRKLEQEDVPLDQLIAYYQRGMELVKVSNHMLKDAEEKMTKILNDNETLEPFIIEEELE